MERKTPCGAFVYGYNLEQHLMDAGPLTLLMNFVAPILLGAAIAGALFYTWRRSRNPSAQARTDAGTRAVYANVERERAAKEGD